MRRAFPSVPGLRRRGPRQRTLEPVRLAGSARTGPRPPRTLHVPRAGSPSASATLAEADAAIARQAELSKMPATLAAASAYGRAPSGSSSCVKRLRRNRVQQRATARAVAVARCCGAGGSHESVLPHRGGPARSARKQRSRRSGPTYAAPSARPWRSPMPAAAGPRPPRRPAATASSASRCQGARRRRPERRVQFAAALETAARLLPARVKEQRLAEQAPRERLRTDISLLFGQGQDASRVLLTPSDSPSPYRWYWPMQWWISNTRAGSPPRVRHRAAARSRTRRPRCQSPRKCETIASASCAAARRRRRHSAARGRGPTRRAPRRDRGRRAPRPGLRADRRAAPVRRDPRPSLPRSGGGTRRLRRRAASAAPARVWRCRRAATSGFSAVSSSASAYAFTAPAVSPAPRAARRPAPQLGGQLRLGRLARTYLLVQPLCLRDPARSRAPSPGFHASARTGGGPRRVGRRGHAGGPAARALLALRLRLDESACRAHRRLDLAARLEDQASELFEHARTGRIGAHRATAPAHSS